LTAVHHLSVLPPLLLCSCRGFHVIVASILFSDSLPSHVMGHLVFESLPYLHFVFNFFLRFGSFSRPSLCLLLRGSLPLFLFFFYLFALRYVIRGLSSCFLFSVDILVSFLDFFLSIIVHPPLPLLSQVPSTRPLCYFPFPVLEARAH